MGVSVNISNDGRIKIDGEMTIYTAAGIKGQLREAQRFAEIEIDLAAVTEIDTAGLQLLVLLKRDSRKHGTQLRLAAMSPIVAETIAVSNLAEIFQ